MVSLEVPSRYEAMPWLSFYLGLLIFYSCPTVGLYFRSGGGVINNTMISYFYQNNSGMIFTQIVVTHNTISSRMKKLRMMSWNRTTFGVTVFSEGIHLWLVHSPHTKGQQCFLLCLPKHTVGQAVELLVIWDEVTTIVTSLMCQAAGLQTFHKSFNGCNMIYILQSIIWHDSHSKWLWWLLLASCLKLRKII